MNRTSTYTDILRALRFLFVSILLLMAHNSWAQVDVKGYVYDKSQLFALPGVSVALHLNERRPDPG